MWKNKRYIISNGFSIITGFFLAYLLNVLADEVFAVVMIGGVATGAVYVVGQYLILLLPENKN